MLSVNGLGGVHSTLFLPLSHWLGEGGDARGAALTKDGRNREDSLSLSQRVHCSLLSPLALSTSRGPHRRTPPHRLPPCSTTPAVEAAAPSLVPAATVFSGPGDRGRSQILARQFSPRFFLPLFSPHLANTPPSALTMPVELGLLTVRVASVDLLSHPRGGEAYLVVS